MRALSDTTFSPKRVYWLLRKHVLGEAPIVAIGAGLALGINLIALLLGGTVPFNHAMASGAPPAGAWTIAIALFGAYLASRSLSGMHGAGATEWILLPASVAEKYAAVLIWTLLVWPLAGALGATLASSALWGVAALAGARGGSVWHPFSSGALLSWASYLAFAPLMIAGSAFWKRNPLIKTIGAMVAASAATLLFVAAFATLSDWSSLEWRGSFSVSDGVIQASGNERLEAAQPWLQGIVDIWRWVILPGSALAFAYFRIAEKEARDEVQ